MEVEFKLLQASGDLKYAVAAGKPVTVEGYASVFNTAPDSYGDIVAPGAYAKAIDGLKKSGRALPLRYEHELVCGKWIDVREDRKGLLVKGELTPGHSVAEDVAASLKHGAVTGLSIGFVLRRAERDAKGIRTLREIDLREVSIVCNPAQLDARVSGVKAAAKLKTPRDFEAWLRGYGFTRREAEEITERGYRAIEKDRSQFRDDHEHRAAVERVLESLRAVKV